MSIAEELKDINRRLDDLEKIFYDPTSDYNRREIRASFSSRYRLLRMFRGTQDALAELEPEYREELAPEEQRRLADSEDEKEKLHQEALASLFSPKS